MAKEARCPICGTLGEDLVFKFWCSKSGCQNFNQKVVQSPSATDVSTAVTQELRALWRANAPDLTEEEFLIKFFATGGRFGLEGDRVILKVRPRWLK